MKIAIISPYPPYRGGISKHSENLCNELIKTQDIIVYNFTRLYPKLLFPGTNQYLDNYKSSKINSIRSIDSINPITWRNTAKDILSKKVDKIIFRYWNPFFIPTYNSIIKYVNKRNKHIKIYAICDNIIAHEKFYFQKYMIRSFIKKLDGIIVMSENVKKSVAQINKNVKCEKIFLPILSDFNEPTSINEARKKLSYNKNKKIFLFFGLIRQYKGLDILLSAINNINKSLLDDFECLIIGESYEKLSNYKSIINENVINKITWITKYVSDKEASLYFSASDFIILPYKSASQSGIIPMAYYYNKPVIASDVDGLKEMLVENETGYLFKNKNSDKLTKILEECILNGYENLNLNKIKSFSDNLSTNSYVNKLLKFIND